MLTMKSIETQLQSAAVVIGLVLGLFILSVAGVSLAMNLQMSEVFVHLFQSTIGSAFGILSVLRRTTYLLIVSIGLAIAFRSGVWNVGGEGQIIWGGLMTAAICLTLNLPIPIIILLSIVASFLAGGLWGEIAGFLKARWNVNEIVSTMMLNFVATASMIEVAGGPLRDPTVLIAQTRAISTKLQFPAIVFPLNVTFVIAIALIPIVYLLMEKSVIGYKMRIVGGSSTVADAAGISTGRIVLLAMFLSGGICALAGSLLVFGNFYRADASITGLFGFYAIVSTLLGKSKPQLMLPTSMLLAFIITGAESLRTLGVPGTFTQAAVGMLFIIVVLQELATRRIK